MLPHKRAAACSLLAAHGSRPRPRVTAFATHPARRGRQQTPSDGDVADAAAAAAAMRQAAGAARRPRESAAPVNGWRQPAWAPKSVSAADRRFPLSGAGTPPVAGTLQLAPASRSCLVDHLDQAVELAEARPSWAALRGCPCRVPVVVSGRCPRWCTRWCTRRRTRCVSGVEPTGWADRSLWWPPLADGHRSGLAPARPARRGPGPASGPASQHALGVAAV
ncbi:uncharacterized protein V1510DRAFT_441254 [Dipodascopsis tothii]|uniref:uncharacterized protein n=1 Tax=Dipodascopsis tothii TaxID=44089 RepID=UPI0034CD1AAD